MCADEYFIDREAFTSITQALRMQSRKKFSLEKNVQDSGLRVEGKDFKSCLCLNWSRLFTGLPTWRNYWIWQQIPLIKRKKYLKLLDNYIDDIYV